MALLLTVLAAGPLRKKLYALINSPRLVLITILVNWIICTVGYMFAEAKGVIASIWWVIVTSFTVGYGDLYPQTDPGRLIGIWVMVTNYLLLAVLLAHILSNFIADKNIFTDEEQEQIKDGIQRGLDNDNKIISMFEHEQRRLAELNAQRKAYLTGQEADSKLGDPSSPVQTVLRWSSKDHE